MRLSDRSNNRVGVILAGGRSSRFGGDKLIARLKGLTLLEIVMKTLESAGFKIVVAGRADYKRFGHPVLEDLHPYEGPLSALAGLFKRLTAPKILLVAGDMPLIPQAVIELLWNQSADSILTLPEGPFGIVPLPGVYSRLLLPAIRRCLRNGRRDLLCLNETSPSPTIISREALATADPKGYSLQNINTRDNLSAVESAMAPS